MAPRNDSRSTMRHRADSGISKKKAGFQYIEAPQPSVGLQPQPPPLEPPPFTVKEIRAAIPKHCFERSYVKSFAYLFWDLTRIVGLAYAATYIESDAVSPMARYVLWPAYWVMQGCIMTGLWVVAHECGHQAFSPSKTVNDAVGLFAHSFLLVPYHSWRITHGNHHKHTCSVEDDEVFLPAVRSRADFAKEMVEESPLFSLIGIVNMLLLGWPMYLLLNIAGPEKYKMSLANSHFTPTAGMFKPREYWDIVVSDIVFLMFAAGLAWATNTFGMWTVFKFYTVPYLIVNYHLVLITFLQHTDTYIPHYRRPEFTFIKGALCTVDRSFGWLMDSTIHHIADTHVAHHMFSQMPHYNCQEATRHLRKLLGPYYLKDDTPIWTALWRSWRSCRFIADEGNMVWFRGPNSK